MKWAASALVVQLFAVAEQTPALSATAVACGRAENVEEATRAFAAKDYKWLGAIADCTLLSFVSDIRLVRSQGDLTQVRVLWPSKAGNQSMLVWVKSDLLTGPASRPPR